MRTKSLLIIAAVAVICITVAAGLFLMQPQQYMNISVGGVELEIPKSNATVTNQTELYSYYNDSESGIAIFVFDSEGFGLNDAGEAVTFAAIRDSFQINSTLQQESNMSYNYSESLKVYTYLTNYTHKNVFIVTKNKEDMKHILSTIKVQENANQSVNATDNSTNNTTQSATTTKSSSQSSSSQKSSSNADDGYHYSAQYGTYIKEWEDASGSHMKSRDGQWEAHYNEKTGVLNEKTPYDGWTSNQM